MEVFACWLVLALPLMAFFVLSWAAVYVDDLRRRRHARAGTCVGCGYHVADLATCPECGMAVAPGPSEEVRTG